MSVAPPHFAQELIDEVLDCLHDDANTLRSCALASISCGMRARKHLHSHLAVGFIGRGPKTSSYPSKVVHHNKIQHLQHHPHLAKCVQTMAASENAESLAQCSLTFPRLHTLRLSNLVWHTQSLQTRLYILSELPHVKSLTLNNVEFESLCSFISLLDAFPALSELSMEQCQFRSGDGREDVQRQISLRRLTVSGDKYGDFIVQWLRAQTILPIIDELVITGGTGLPSDQLINDLVSTAGSSLRHLRFGFGWIWPGSQPNLRFDFSSNEQLRTLEVKNIFLRMDMIRISHYGWLPDMLQRIRSRQLRRITLHLHYESLSQLDDEGLRKIDEALGGTTDDVRKWALEWRAGLMELEFVLWPSRVHGCDRQAAISQAAASIAEKMPRSVHNKVLRCYDGSTYSATWIPIERFSE